MDHAEQGRDPPEESVTVVVGGLDRTVVAPPPPCCCFCEEATRLGLGNRELLRDSLLFGKLILCVFFNIIMSYFQEVCKRFLTA